MLSLIVAQMDPEREHEGDMMSVAPRSTEQLSTEQELREARVLLAWSTGAIRAHVAATLLDVPPGGLWQMVKEHTGLVRKTLNG